MLAELGEATEGAIWNTIRSLHESAMLLTHLAEHWRPIDPAACDEFLRKARAENARAERVRRVAWEEEILSAEKIARRSDG